MRIRLRTLVLRLLLVVTACALLALGRVLDPTHAVLLCCLGVAAVVLRAGAVDEAGPEWPGRPVTGRAGGRRVVSDLSWQVFGRDGRVRKPIVDRVAAVASARLALLGLDPADPRHRPEIERLLGPGVRADIAAWQLPTARTLQTWLDAIDRLGSERTIP